MLDNSCKWKPCHIFPDYYMVSSDGKVYSVRNRKCISPAKDKSGYLYYVLCVGGERKTIKAHRLVAIAFIPNPDNKKTVDHINAIRTDNRVENLRWASLEEQWANDISHQRHLSAAAKVAEKNRGKPSKQRIPIAVYKNGERVGVFDSITDAAKVLGLNAGKVSECISEKRKTTGGYTVAKYQKCRQQEESGCFGNGKAAIAVTKYHFGEE